MRAAVPLLTVGRSEGVDTYNGVLVHALESLSIEALPLDFPGHIEVDISVLRELDSALYVRDLPVPSNVTVLNDLDAMVVKVEPSRVAAEAAAIDAEAEAAAAEAVEPAEAEEAPQAQPAAEQESAGGG
jgi:hypothetical protein